MENSDKKIVIFTDGDVALDVPISPEKETVWLNRNQMSILFDRDVKTIGKHINNALKEELNTETSVVAKFATTAKDGKKYQVDYYNLDVIISVGYRVKSKRGIAFRRWANSVLKEYLLQGYSLNQKRLEQLNRVIDVISRSSLPEVVGISSVLKQFTSGLNLLDGYDHENLKKTKPKKNSKTNTTSWRLTYDEGRKIIEKLKFVRKSNLFGNEKDDSFKSAIGAIYQTYDGNDVYPTSQEKAANLLYFLVKNHAFSDGNKRIAAAIFVCFLDKNEILYKDNGSPVIDNNTLAAMTLMIALSRPEEKEIMCLLVMNMIEIS